MARRVGPHTVDPHMAGGDQGGGGNARTYHPRVPKPFVDTLATLAHLSAVFVGLELRFERRELGEW